MVLLFGRPWVVYSSPSPLHLHYFDNTTAPLLILQDNNDPRRRPSPCGEGSVRYMRAFTKAAIAAVRSSSSSSSSSSGTSISSKSSSNRSITRKYSSSRDGPNGCRGEGGGPGIAGSRLGWGENRREKQRCPGGTGCRAGKGRAAVWTSQAEVRKRHFGKQLESAVGR